MKDFPYFDFAAELARAQWNLYPDLMQAAKSKSDLDAVTAEKRDEQADKADPRSVK